MLTITGLLTITGASDDLIEIEGDITEEFNHQDDEKGDLLAFSDGTVLRILYTTAGIWRITPVSRGAAALAIDVCAEADPHRYSDKATLSGPEITWAVHGVAIARKS